MEEIKNLLANADQHLRSVQKKTKDGDRVPLFVDRAKADDSKLKHRKFLVPPDQTLGQFMFDLRSKYLEQPLRPEEALFTWIYSSDGQHVVPTPSKTMKMLWAEHKNPETGFLILMVGKEVCFGGC